MNLGSLVFWNLICLGWLTRLSSGSVALLGLPELVHVGPVATVITAAGYLGLQAAKGLALYKFLRKKPSDGKYMKDVKTEEDQGRYGESGGGSLWGLNSNNNDMTAAPGYEYSPMSSDPVGYARNEVGGFAVTNKNKIGGDKLAGYRPLDKNHGYYHGYDIVDQTLLNNVVDIIGKQESRSYFNTDVGGYGGRPTRSSGGIIGKNGNNKVPGSTGRQYGENKAGPVLSGYSYILGASGKSPVPYPVRTAYAQAQIEGQI